MKAGNSSQQSKVSTNIAVWDVDDFSYLDAFFTKDGHYLTNVWDCVIKENWKFDKKITDNVTKLVNTSAFMVGHDLEVTALPSEFPLDSKNGRNLITRSLSRGVVADCFEHSEVESVYAIIGAPGIGKSWSLIYALQQALLFENVCVLFCFQKKSRAWVCIRKKNQIYAWSVTSGSLETNCNSGLFNNGNVLALLDPKEAPKGGASYILERQRLIFAASNNAAHFKNIYKDTPEYERILNPYSTLELKTALKYMSPSGVLYSDDEVLPMLRRAEELGNKPRYVMSEVHSRSVLKKINIYLHGVDKMDSVMLLKFLSFSGIIAVKEQDSIDGAVYSLYADGSIYPDFSLVDVGYDGDAVVDGSAVVDYGERSVEFASNYIRIQVAIEHRASLLSYDGKTADGLGSHFGYIVEELFWMDMKKNIRMKVHKLSYKEGKGGAEEEEVEDDDDNLVVGNDDNGFETFYFGDATSLADRAHVKELSEVFFGKDGKKYKCRMVVNFPCIDFVGPDRRVYQVTVKKDRSMNSDGLLDVLISAGILEEEDEGTDKKVRKVSYSRKSKHVLELSDAKPNLLQEWKIKFYWVVPEGVSKRWINKHACKVAQSSKNSDLLNDALEKFVDQYVAIISSKLQHAQSIADGK